MRALATAGLVTALGLAQAEMAFAQAREAVEYTTLTRRVTGGPPFPVRAVLTSAEEYGRFFRTREPAQCDFANEFLILVHLGTEGSQGYTVRITSVERVQSNPPVVTVKYRLTPGAGNAGTVGARPTTRPEDPPVVAEAPAELIKVRRSQPRDRHTSAGIDLARDQLRFFEEGGMERVGFNVIARTLAGEGAFEQVTVDFTGDVKVRMGSGEPKKTRLLLSELDRMAIVAQNSQIKSLPRTVPTQQLGGRRFFFNHFDGARRRTIVEGTHNHEGAYADRIRPLSQAFDLILGRLERRPIQVEGLVELVEEADAVRIQGPLGLSYYLRGPLARKLVVLQGRKVVLEAVAQLKSSTEAEGVIRQVIYPQRSQIAGTIAQQGGKLVIVPAYPMPDAPIPLLGPRASELVTPEIGKPVMLDMWLMFNDRGLPNEGFVESILAITLSHVVLRDRPESQSMPTGELPERTTVWVSARRGGGEGVALAAANMKSGWVPSQLLRFHYNPKVPGLAEGLDPRNPNESGDPRLRGRIERELEDERNRSRNPNVDRPR
ncbi:MAG: hypothetical protein M9894_30680 [Planctomycetes bacterium]|nr:hypothetical protein [Planctomycetota bacterium]